MRTVGLLVLALSLAATPVAASAATSTRFVVGERIGPVAVGDERATLEVSVGPGSVIARQAHPSGNPNLARERVRYGRVRIDASFRTAEASTPTGRITTTATRYRTASGIGVGSTRAALRAAYPSVRCGPTSCQTAKAVDDIEVVVTRFGLHAGRVSRLTLIRFAVV